MSSDSKALALAAKERGNALFAKKTRESYEQALLAYQEAIEHDPAEHVFHANVAACHIEVGNDEWQPQKKVDNFARALVSARKCTQLGPSWVKGYVRQASVEFELVGSVAKAEERKKQDEKYRKEDEERAEADRKEGKKPFLPERKPEPDLDPVLKLVADGASYTSCEAVCRKGLELEPQNALLRTRLQSLRDAGHATDEAKDQAMRDVTAAAAMKAHGNAAFAAKKWKEAVEHYSKALEQDPLDHVFYSNRSACYAESEEFDRALSDAERCIALSPQFAKGYSRQAHALFHVGRYVEMETAANKGLELDASSVALQDLLKQAQIETAETPEVQAQMHKFRQEKRKDAKLQDLMKGLNMGGQNIQMFGPGDDLSGLLGGGGGGRGGLPGFGGGGGKSAMTEEQMRGMARAMGQAPAAGSSPAAGQSVAPKADADGAAKDGYRAGPTVFAPP